MVRAQIDALVAELQQEHRARLEAEARNAAALTLLKQGPTGGTDPELAAAVGRFLTPGNHPVAPTARGGAVTTVGSDVGNLLISASDDAILPRLRRDGTWEPSEGRVIGEVLRLGMVAIDIGAHVGYRTLQMARAVGPQGRVISVEAAPGNFALLAANVHRNGLENVFLVHAAAGDQTGPVDLAISASNTGDNRLFARPGEDTIQVPMVRLDDVIPADTPVSFIKCDVQGYDVHALRGLERTIQRCRPNVVVEYCPRDIRDAGDTPGETLAYYRSLGYRLEVIDSDLGARPATDVEVVEAAEAAEHAYVNVMLVPLPMPQVGSADHGPSEG